MARKLGIVAANLLDEAVGVLASVVWLPHFSLSQETNNWDVLIPLAIGSALMTVGAAAVIVMLALLAIMRSVLRSFVTDRN